MKSKCESPVRPLQAFLCTCWSHPHLLLLWLLVLLICLGLGLTAVLVAAHQHIRTEKDEALSMATALVSRITLALEVGPRKQSLDGATPCLSLLSSAQVFRASPVIGVTC